MSAKLYGVSIITCDRVEFVSRLLSTLSGLDIPIIIINDGEKDLSNYFLDNKSVSYFKTEHPRSGVGKAKNRAIKELMYLECDNLFLLEDDILIKDVKVFKRYIDTSRASGIQHFNFAFHGTDNYNADGTPAKKLKVEYSDDCAVTLYPNVYGALSFYTKACILECGYMDETYYNALEHVDHTNKIIRKRMHPPFRWFADIDNSHLYLEEQDEKHTQSVIRKDSNWVQNFHKMADYFAEQNNFDVRDPHAKVADKQEVIQSLKEIKKLWKK